ncbi:zinc finger HIT domain-containing protein [Halorubrum gandharaense]
MSVEGLCDVCEAAEGRYTCDRCGAFVCPKHWDADAHVCLECAEVAEDPDQPSGFKLDD